MSIVIYFIVIIALSLPYLIDVYINGLSFLKRIKIGKWDNYNKWRAAISKKAERWILKPPVVKKTDNSRFYIVDILKGNYKNNAIQSWQIGLVYLSIVDRDKHTEYINYFINDKGDWKNKPKEIDFSILALAILKDAYDINKVKPAMDHMYNLILSRVQENDGCVAYRLHCKTQRYVDTIGFVCPFLAYYGKVYNCNEAIFLSKYLIKSFYALGFDKKMNLPIHAYDSLTNYPLGIYGWGRGTGWFLLGITDTYLILKDNDLKNMLKELADCYIKFQNENGSYSSIIQIENLSESSVTSIMAYFYAICANEFGSDIYMCVSEKAISYLMKVTRKNGEIDFSQGDTKGIGYYSMTSDIMPFTQGMACRAVLNLRKGDLLNE